MTVGSNGLAQSVLVVGGGMYVAGRGVDGYRGTIGPALLEARRRGVVGRLAVATTRIDTARDAADRLATLGRDMGVDGTIEIFPEDSTDDNPTGTALAAFRPDAAVVAVPDDNHAAVCVPLIHGGVHCLVVKPLAGTVADARTMADAADRTGVVAQVEFHKRLDESNLLLRSAVSEGRLGDPLYAVVEYSQRKTIPRDVFRGWATRTDIFQYLGVHYVDLVHWATGFRPARVTAWGQKVYLAELGIDTWDAMQVVVEWIQPDGRPFVSTHISNWVDPDRTSAMSDQRITIVGTAGRYQADQKHRGVQLVTDDAGAQDLNPYFTGVWQRDDNGITFDGYGIRSIGRFLDDVIDVRAGRVTAAELQGVRPTFHDGLISTAVIEAARYSIAASGTPTSVPAA